MKKKLYIQPETLLFHASMEQHLANGTTAVSSDTSDWEAKHRNFFDTEVSEDNRDAVYSLWDD